MPDNIVGVPLIGKLKQKLLNITSDFKEMCNIFIYVY